VEWSRLRNLCPSSNGWLLLGAVLSGVLALFASRHYLQQRESALRESTTRALETRPVIVAARDLRSGDLLGTADLAIRQVPRRYAPSDSLAPDAATQLLGRRLIHARRSGDGMALGDIESARSASLAARLPDGMRALTIPVDELGSFSGQLRAGDRVDLYFLPQAGGEASRIGLLLSAVLVLATGSEASGIGTPDPSVTGGHAEFSTITLQLSPDDAERVALAQRAGQLTTVLRGRDDAGAVVSSVRFAKTLLAASAAARPVREPERTSIELIVGGRGSTVAEAGQMSVSAAHE
jgi:pilus assembly protein CpaB